MEDWILVEFCPCGHIENVKKSTILPSVLEEIAKETGMEKISLNKFYFDSITRCRKNGERYGQGMFNHLCEVKPDLAEKVRGTNMDPFYCSSPMEAKFDRFINFIEANWS